MAGWLDAGSGWNPAPSLTTRCRVGRNAAAFRGAGSSPPTQHPASRTQRSFRGLVLAGTLRRSAQRGGQLPNDLPAHNGVHPACAFARRLATANPYVLLPCRSTTPTLRMRPSPRRLFAAARFCPSRPPPRDLRLSWRTVLFTPHAYTRTSKHVWQGMCLARRRCAAAPRARRRHHR